MLLLTAAALAAPLHHDLVVTLDVEAHALAVVDRITVDVVNPEGHRFWLHAGLGPVVETKGWVLEATGNEPPKAGVPLEQWVLRPKKPKKAHKAGLPVQIRYGGTIHHPMESSDEEYARSFAETPGTIEGQGVFLSGSTAWVPDFDALYTFSLAVGGLPGGWDYVSQTARTETGWATTEPMEEAYLVAAPFNRYATRTASGVDVEVLLREPDPGLAFRYQQATERYLALYERMLPPYPYSSFAVVENFWETGYGMPGFTLLGPKVIRMPWVLTSSYPHEILHNWWGNAAYPSDAGNWCEGLTAYMADHLFAEHRGQGAAYRRGLLQKFTDVVGDEQDFPLVEFRNRSSSSSEAVGYGKSAMLWHMVRRQIGDEAFLESLRTFYTAEKYQRTGFAELGAYFGDDVQPMVEAYIERTGAPKLELASAEVEAKGGQWRLALKLVQTQKADPFPVRVPVQITLEDGTDKRFWLGFDEREAELALLESVRPVRIDVDPDFEVMRRLDPLEVAPAFTTIWGDPDKVFVLPSAAPEDERAAWKKLAAAWGKGKAKVVSDTDIEALPPGAVVLGWTNTHASTVATGAAHTGAVLEEGAVHFQDEVFGAKTGHSALLIARSEADVTRAVAWVAGPTDAIPGLSRKLPHYGKYAMLAFEGTAPDNVAKATAQAAGSPLVKNLAPEAPLADRPAPDQRALAEMPPRFEADALLSEATWHADPAREGRGLGSDGLEASTARLEASLKAIGLAPTLGDSFRQTWDFERGDMAATLTNLVATVPGAKPGAKPVLVMAHLDHLGEGWPDVREGNAGKVHPGADDNASGVAVALELARALAAEPPRPRPVIIAFTTGEEAGLLGAKKLLEALPDAPMGCVALDTVGRLGDDKLVVAGAPSAREWRFLFLGVGYTTGAELGFAATGLAASDHAACHAAGIPAVQLTTGPHADYHAPGDTADKLDGPGLVTVAEVTLEAVAYLAERADPLTAQLTEGGKPAAVAGGERRASLGTMPDFTFEGPGVKVADVMPDSAAMAAGLQAGDVLLSIDGVALKDLRSFSKLLKGHKPGDLVEIRFVRGGAEQTVDATLKVR